MTRSSSSSSCIRAPLKSFTTNIKKISTNSRSLSADRIEFNKLWELEARKAYPKLGKTLHKPASQFRVGIRYLKGDEDYVKCDPKKALYWITKAAEGGDDKALCQLGKIYTTGKLVEQDTYLAECYFRLAKSLDNQEAEEIVAYLDMHKDASLSTE